MAKFTTYYNLAPINDTKEFQGIAKDKVEGNIITTLEKNIVIVLKISSQKQIKSWTSFDKLSSKVLYDQKSQKYVGVFGRRSIRCWDENTTDLNKVKKVTFHRDIGSLVQNGDDGEILVLYLSGETETLSSAIRNRKHGSEEPHHTNTLLTDASIFCPTNGNKILTFFEKQEESFSLIISSLESESLKTLTTYKYKILRADIPLSGYCIFASGNLFEFISIWADKRVFIQNLNNVSPSDDIVGHFTSMLTTLNVDKPMSILGLSDHCVAIYGANTVQEGASLLLYNTQFKVIQAQQFFKVHFDFSRLWFFCNSIILAMGPNLSVVSFKMTRQLLSDLIGSQVQNQFEERITDDFINEDEELEETLEYSDIQPKLECLNHETEISVETILADGLTVPFYPIDAFNKDIRSELTLTGFEVNLVEDDDFNITVNSAPFPTKEIDIVASEMEKCGASEHEIVEKLLHVLLKGNRLEDILICFERYTNIPEKMLVKTLLFVLKSYDESNEIKSKIMKAIISCSFDEDTLSQHIRNEFQNITHVLKIFEILYDFITRPEYILEERAESCHEFDEEMQIFKWFGFFLGTHFQQLVLSKDEQLLQYLGKWIQLVDKFRNNITELQEVSSFLYKLFENKTSAIDKSYSKWYFLEEIKLF
ncbi:NOL11 family protein [Megaselia abdita]